MPPKDKYSDPKLRDEVKEEIHNSDKGGAPGQWSARKAQMMASEYKKRGGGYNTEKSEQDQSQKHLSEWTEEEWQTKEGSGHAKQADGTEKRYLPKKAWEQMSEGEKEETDQKKQAGSKEGKQFVGNTEKAKESRENANQEEKEKYEEKKAREKEQQKKGGEGEEEDAAEQEGDEEYQEDEEGSEEGSEAEGESEGEEASAGQKRTRGQQNGSKKSQKDNAGKGQSKGSPKKQQNGNKSDKNDTVGSKHQKNEDPAPKGSADRLPKKGQQVHWKAMPGFVDGEVTDILTGEQEVDGKNVKASEKDPRIVLKSNSSGKICVHKPEACYYD